MKKLKTIILLVLVNVLISSCSTGKGTKNCPFSSDPNSKDGKALIELSGTLQRPSNGLPQIYLGEYGKIRRIDLKGEKIEGIKDATPIRIYGFMRSKYFDGGTNADQLSMPAQWKLWIDVKKVKILEEEL